MRIISIYPNFRNKGGAQNVCVQLASRLNQDEVGVILTNTKQADIPLDYKNNGAVKFERFSVKNICKYANNDTIFLSHHRKTTTLLILLFRLLCSKQKIVHIAHNTFSNLRFLSLFPRYIVAVSSAVSENLQRYFRIPSERIRVIHNGIVDRGIGNQATSSQIQILFLGRLTRVKQQIEFVRRTKGELPPNVRFDFAGSGEDKSELLQIIGEDTHYRYIGQIDVHKHISDYDYVCLFSQKEGLGLSLIEGCMYAKPLITNGLRAVLDVNTDTYNGFVFSTWEELVRGLKNLPERDTASYQRLSRNARARYEERFTEEMMLENYKQFLEQVLVTKA